MPKKGKVIVYQEPNALVNKDPRVAKKLFVELQNDVRQYLKGEVSVLSISLGNMHGFYIASKYKNVKRLISVLPGPELGRNIWKSCASQSIRENSKGLHFTQKKYDKVIEDFNCEHNCFNLPKSSVFYIAKSDDYIPTEDQMDLINNIKEKHRYKEIHYFYLGHVLSHVYFGLLNRMNKIPWDVEE